MGITLKSEVIKTKQCYLKFGTLVKIPDYKNVANSDMKTTSTSGS